MVIGVLAGEVEILSAAKKGKGGGVDSALSCLYNTPHCLILDPAHHTGTKN